MGADILVIDTAHCDQEPIHVPGTIQPFGFLVALSPDWMITRVSENIGAFTGHTPQGLLGKPLGSLVSNDAEHRLRNLGAHLHGADAVERAFDVVLMDDGKRYDVAIHWSGSSLIIEAESAAGSTDDAATLVRTMVVRLDHIGVMAEFLREGARQIRALTGFDRVMVYRFDATGSGEVVAETLKSGLDSYIGLNYPASDIPAQARSLYLRSVFRIIADVGAAPVPIVPVLDASGEPLDQSMSVLRAVSPVHLEYLRNMGVAASLSISIIVEGKLWGLFACHHHAPRLPSFAMRSAAELFGRMFSMMLESREHEALRNSENAGRSVAAQLIASAARDGNKLGDPAWLGDVVFGAIAADGIGVSIDGDIALTGSTPDRAQFQRIVEILTGMGSNQVIATDRIVDYWADAAAFTDKAAGMIAIPVSGLPRDYVVWFRDERLHSVKWAGNPEKDFMLDPSGLRLSPRKSFESWSEIVRGRSLPFNGAELRVAEALRVALLQIGLQQLDAAGRDMARAHEHQELLIGELNHRVRNILSLIRGLISQSRDSLLSAEAFVSTLDDRVQALARAHDQLTAERWGPARLIELIRTETQAYLGDGRDRIMLEGPDILIEPAAFTALALVVHELVTNATKYGALRDHGRVSLTWVIEDGGDLAICWRETGGPPVYPPTRRGFGSTIIETSVSYDLGGSAKTSYATTGFEADFTIPSKYIGDIYAAMDDAPTPVEVEPLSIRPLDHCTVLLVEDNMIIAFDCEDNLRRLGAKDVLTAPSVERAVAIVKGHQLDFAILDYSLGDETSLAVAKLLTVRQVPFLFATGYGDPPDVDGDLKRIGVIRKPYNFAVLEAAIVAAGPLRVRL